METGDSVLWRFFETAGSVQIGTVVRVGYGKECQMASICNPLRADLRQHHPPNAVLGALTLWAQVLDQTLFLPFNMTVAAMIALPPKEEDQS